MKIRYLTLLTTLVFLGFTVSAFAAKPVYFTYNVVIAGAVSGESGDSWGYNGKQVYSQRGRNEKINLNYFREFFNEELGGRTGENCFGDITNGSPTDPYLQPIFGGFLRKHKKDAANGMFWFPGFTGDAVTSPDRKAVLYLLQVTGEFDDPASWPEDGNLMVMPYWELTVENEGKDVASRSCEYSEKWTDSGDIMIVSVTKQP